MKKALISLAALVVLAGIGLWQFSSTGKTAPDVTFTTLDGQKMSLTDLRGDVVLVKFWATNCVTCIQQMPDAIQTYNRFSGDGYQVVAVAMAYDNPDYVVNFTESRELPFSVVYDESGDLAQAFGDVQLTPTAFLIDKQGRIIKRYLGNYDQATFVATIEKALAS